MNILSCQKLRLTFQFEHFFCVLYRASFWYYGTKDESIVFLFLLCIFNPFHVIIKHLNINKRLILFILLYLLTFKSKFLVILYFFFRLPLYFVTETNNNRKWKKKSAKMHSVKNVL